MSIALRGRLTALADGLGVWTPRPTLSDTLRLSSRRHHSGPTGWCPRPLCRSTQECSWSPVARLHQPGAERYLPGLPLRRLEMVGLYSVGVV